LLYQLVIQLILVLHSLTASHDNLVLFTEFPMQLLSFQCGDKYHTFCQATTAWVDCKICHQNGHKKKLCPDLWRRYCYTTSGNIPVQPKSLER